MIHICKSSTGYLVVTLAKNREVLSCSEVLKSKQSCWKNIRSHLIEWSSGIVMVQDDTIKSEPKVYSCYNGGDDKFYKERDILADVNSRYIPSVKKVKYKPRKQ